MKRGLGLAVLAGALAACASAPGALPATFTPAAVAERVSTSAFPTLPPPYTATFTPTPSATPTITPTPFPSLTPSATPSVTPQAVARPLTSGGCCVQPFFSADSNEVWFIDKPPGQPAGVWGVPLTGGPARLVTQQLGAFSPDMQWVAYPENGSTWVADLTIGTRWRLTAAAGRAVMFSPDKAQAAWQVASSSLNFDRRLVEFWVGASQGETARKVGQLVAGGLAGWLNDGHTLIVTGRESLDTEPLIGLLDTRTDTLTPLLRQGNVRGLTLSPDGAWLAYQVAFSGQSERDGLWLAPVDASAPPTRLALFGAYRWRDTNRLLVIPLEPGQPLQVWQVTAPTATARPLTTANQTPLPIAQGDWTVSPDGAWLAFVSAQDRNIYVLRLP